MKKIFTVRNISGMAVFAALAYLISFIEIPIFPSASFLKLDFANVFIMLGGFMYGVIPGIIISAIKEFLCFITKSSTGGVGEIANFLTTLAFIALPATLYRFKKGLKVVIPSLIAACFLQTGASLLANRFINFPLFGIANLFGSFFWIIIAFNMIKSVSVSIITVLLYKRVNVLFKKIHLKTDDSSAPASDGVKKNKKSRYNTDEFISKSEKETIAFAENLAKTLKGGDTVSLSGDLGAGKTAFTKGLAKGLGITDPVTSPTYAYLNVYGDKLYHFDFYRLRSGEQAEALGLTEYFNADNVCVVEWGENVKEILPERMIKINIEKLGKNKRRITVTR